MVDMRNRPGHRTAGPGQGVASGATLGGIGDLQDGVYFRRIRPNFEGTFWENGEYRFIPAFENNQFQTAGIDLPRVSLQQFTAGGHVPVKQAQPGDLLFYATDPSDPATIHHVMLYMGDGQMVEAPYSGESVRVRSVPWGYSELVPLATRPGTTPNSRA